MPPDPHTSPSLAPSPRELPLRDVRDLALAVIEGAVAAESLAKELRRTPDRSRHFQDIAERLRSVVGRPSIRLALTQEQAPQGAPPRASNGHPITLPTPPQLVGLQKAATPPCPPPSRSERPQREIAIEPSDSGEHSVAELIAGSPQLDRIEAHLQNLATLATAQPPHAREHARELGALVERLARLEDLLLKMASQRDEGERYTLRSPEEAIALAARLTERLRRDPRVMVRIEPT